MLKIFLVQSFFLAVAVHSLRLPSFIKKCSRSDPNLDECAVKHANQALQNVLKGLNRYDVPNFMPLYVPLVHLESAFITMELKNCYIYGLNSTKISKIHIDFPNKKVEVTAFINRVNIQSNYSIDGKALILPIKGEGPANVTLIDGEYKYSFDYVLTRKTGKTKRTYVKITNQNMLFKTRRNYIVLHNLFNGDKMLGNTLNKFMDENWRDVTEELKPSLQEAIGLVITSIVSRFLAKVPSSELFSA